MEKIKLNFGTEEEPNYKEVSLRKVTLAVSAEIDSIQLDWLKDSEELDLMYNSDIETAMSKGGIVGEAAKDALIAKKYIKMKKLERDFLANVGKVIVNAGSLTDEEKTLIRTDEFWQIQDLPEVKSAYAFFRQA